MTQLQNLFENKLRHIEELENELARLEAFQGIQEQIDATDPLALGIVTERLSPRIKQMCQILYRHKGIIISKDHIMGILYADKIEPPHGKVLDVMLSKLRKVLSDDWKIKAVYGEGIALSQTSRGQPLQDQESPTT